MKASSFVGGIGKAFTIAFLAVLALAVLYPLLWMVLNGFKTNAQLFGDPFALPTQFTFENYIKAWDRGVKDYVAVSALVTITSTICTVLISAWAAFGLTRVHLPFNRVITVIILSGLMLAPAVTLIPLVQMMQRMGLYNTWWALLILYTAFRVPFTTFLIRAYMVDLPREVDEAGLSTALAKLERSGKLFSQCVARSSYRRCFSTFCSRGMNISLRWSFSGVAKCKPFRWD